MPMSWYELGLASGITRRELQLSLRGPAFWGLSAAGALYALWRATATGATLALACYQVVQIAVIGLGVVAVLLGGAAAGRDAREQAAELVLAKPLGSRPLVVLSRVAGVWLVLLTIVLVMLAAILLGQLISSGAPWQPAIYGNAFARCLVPIGLAVGLGFTLTTAFASPLAAALAAVYWVAIPLARQHLPAVFDVTVAQHWPMSALFAAGLIGFSSYQHGKAIAGAPRRGLVFLISALFSGGLLAVVSINSSGADALTEPDRVLIAMSHQTAERGARAPGFWLPDVHRQLIGLSDLEGRPVLLAFWGPADPASVSLLATMKTLAARHRDQLVCVAVCVDRDSAALAPFAHEVGPEVMMLWDRGTHFAPGQLWLDSPVATAYAVEQVPVAFLIDRNRVIAQHLMGMEPDLFAAAVTRFMEGE